MKYVIENEATVSRPEREPELIVSVLFAFLAFIRGPMACRMSRGKNQ